MSSYQDYIAKLPQGLDSYPECQVKAAFLKNMFDLANIEFDSSGIPEELRLLLKDPPPASVFIPTVHFLALSRALRNAFNDDDAFFEHALADTRRNLSSPLYRALFLFVSPRKLVEHAGGRWRKIHKGVTLESKLSGPMGCNGVFNFPPDLADQFTTRIWVRAVCVGLEMTGAKNVEVTSLQSTSIRCTFSIEWSH